MILTKVKQIGNQNLLSLSQTLLPIEDQRKVILNLDNTMLLLISLGLMSILRTKKLPWEANIGGSLIKIQLLVNMTSTQVKHSDNPNLL